MMQLDGTRTIFSPSDLVAFADCAHLTQLERAAAAKLIQKPYFDDPTAEALAERGRRHEERCLAWLEHGAAAAAGGSRPAGARVTRIQVDRDLGLAGVEAAARATLDAMRRGDRFIYQATFFANGWRGHADFLLRVDKPSPAFPWSYEPADAKLARHAKVGAILQLCAYAEMIESMQGCLPEHIHLYLGGPEHPTHEFRLGDFFAYYKWLKREFLAAVSNGSATFPPTATYPIPVDRCDSCNWSAQCNERRHIDDHLSLVADIRRNHRVALERRGVTTMAQLVDLGTPIKPPLEHASPEAVERVWNQARIQVEGRNEGRVKHERNRPSYPIYLTAA